MRGYLRPSSTLALQPDQCNVATSDMSVVYFLHNYLAVDLVNAFGCGMANIFFSIYKFYKMRNKKEIAKGPIIIKRY